MRVVKTRTLLLTVLLGMTLPLLAQASQFSDLEGNPQ